MATCSYLVQSNGTTTQLAIVGNASYVNCGDLRSFLEEAEQRTMKTDLFVDFRRCTGVDSTILGILADCAMRLAEATPRGRIIFANLDGHSLDVARNLGMHHIVEIADVPVQTSTELASPLGTSMCSTQHMLEAHKALIRLHPENEPRFHDVVEALKSQL